MKYTIVITIESKDEISDRDLSFVEGAVEETASLLCDGCDVTARLSETDNAEEFNTKMTDLEIEQEGQQDTHAAVLIDRG